MTVDEAVDLLGLRVLAGRDLERKVTGGYASDMLSCVMAKAKEGNIWVTLQAHQNVVAVGSLLNLAAIVVTEGVEPDHDTLARADEQGVVVLSSAQDSFAVAGRLYEAGIRGSQPDVALSTG
ncbi:MAG TPA: DRTGG domain-containing protein [Anaerolineae bacterium]|nr:DRTGG domain-containing protein [Anaerolineae bacterium]